MEQSHALAATLGTEPQVVLLAFAVLVRQGLAIRRCLVFHTLSPQPAIRRAVQHLKRAWPHWAPDVPLDFKALPLEDLDSQSALARAYRAIRESLQDLKNAGFVVHLCVSGGRKPLALAAFLTAQFLFGPQDRLWHLYSPPEAENEDPRQLLRDPRVCLLDLPVPIWTNMPLFLQAVSQYRDPWTAATVQRSLVRHAERSQAFELLEKKLTEAEREVVRELVVNGGTNRDIANRLGKSARTVGHQLASVYRKVRQELGPAIPVDRTAVASLFAPVLRLGQMTDVPGGVKGHNGLRR